MFFNKLKYTFFGSLHCTEEQSPSQETLQKKYFLIMEEWQIKSNGWNDVSVGLLTGF
jgi:hypothetical protein